MGVHPHEEDPVDARLGAVVADRLGDSEDMGFVEAVGEGGAAVSGGAEGDALGLNRRVGHAGVVGGNQFGNIDQIGLGGTFSGVGVQTHG